MGIIASWHQKERRCEKAVRFNTIEEAMRWAEPNFKIEKDWGQELILTFWEDDSIYRGAFKRFNGKRWTLVMHR